MQCPRCADNELPLQHHEDHWRCPECGLRMPERDGVISGPFADVKYREIADQPFMDMLRMAREDGWQRAAEAHADIPGVNPAYLGKITRADFKYLLPLTPQSTVLDAGAGLGTVTQVIAPMVDTCVALENDRLRMTFTQLRLQQEGVNNVLCLHANLLEAPLRSGIFDVIILNGVLEWVGLQEDATAGVIQQRVLRNICRMLKPGGMLYVGTDNRYALAQLKGAPEPHTMLPYTGVVPRPLAHLLVRKGYRRGQGWSRSPMLAREFRTWTYSLGGYRRLLRGAGFEQVKCWLPHPTYNQPHRIVEQCFPAVRFYLLHAISGKSAWHRLIRRFEGHCRIQSLICEWYARVSGFFDFTAVKPGAAPAGASALQVMEDTLRTHWDVICPGRPPPGAMSFYLRGTEPNWPRTVVMIDRRTHRVTAVGKFSRNAETFRRIQRERRNMQVFAEFIDLPVCAFLFEKNGVAMSLRGGMPGFDLGHLLRPDRPTDNTEYLERVHRWLMQLHRHVCPKALAFSSVEPHWLPVRRLVEEHLAEHCATIDRQFSELRKSGPLPRVPMHGDFVLSNIWLDGQERLIPIDWEDADREGWPLMDLTMLAIDLALKRRVIARQSTVQAQLVRMWKRHLEVLDLKEGTGRCMVTACICRVIERHLARASRMETLQPWLNALEKNLTRSEPMNFI